MKDEQFFSGWDPVVAKLIDESQDLQSVRFEDLEPEQIVTIRTQHTTFLLAVTNREGQRVAWP